MREDMKNNEERKEKDDEECFEKITETLILSPGSKVVNQIAKTHSLCDKIQFIY